MLVWGRLGPAAPVQAEWTAALARGLGRDALLVDVISTPLSMSLVHARRDLKEEIERRTSDLTRLSREKFHDVSADVQVWFSRSVHREFCEVAADDRRAPIVLWGPVPERLIRKLLHRVGRTVLVIRASDRATKLPWVGAQEDDEAALDVAGVLARGADREMSVRPMPAIDPEDTDGLPCGIACVTCPTPGWWRSHLCRRRRGEIDSLVPVVEVYCTDTSATDVS